MSLVRIVKKMTTSYQLAQRNEQEKNVIVAHLKVRRFHGNIIPLI